MPQGAGGCRYGGGSTLQPGSAGTGWHLAKKIGSSEGKKKAQQRRQPAPATLVVPGGADSGRFKGRRFGQTSPALCAAAGAESRVCSPAVPAFSPGPGWAAAGGGPRSSDLGTEGRESGLRPGPAGFVPPPIPREMERCGPEEGRRWASSGFKAVQVASCGAHASGHGDSGWPAALACGSWWACTEGGMGKGCRRLPVPRAFQLCRDPEPKGFAAALTCGEGGEEPGVALGEGGVADPAEIEHHGSPHYEHHVPRGRGRRQRGCPAGVEPASPPPGGTGPRTVQTPGDSPRRLGEALEEIRVEEADGPIHGLVHPLVVLLPQVAHLPQQGLLPVHQVLREQTAVVSPRDPHTAPAPGTKLRCSCGISGCKPLPTRHEQLLLAPSSPGLPASTAVEQASTAGHTSAPSSQGRGWAGPRAIAYLPLAQGEGGCTWTWLSIRP